MTSTPGARTASFDEIRGVVLALPPYDPRAAEAAKSAIAAIDPVGMAGDLGALAAWAAGARRRESPIASRPRLAIFAASHGIAADLSGGNAVALGIQVAALIEGDAVLHRLAAAVDIDLRLYELALDRPSADSRSGPALDEEATARAVAYGMMAVEPGVDVLAVAGLGAGADLSAAVIGQILYGGDAGDWSPLYPDRVAAAARRHAALADPLALLAALGGADIAAMLGAILAARLAGIPVILDGAAALAAGWISARLRPDALDHCRAAAHPTIAAGFGADRPPAPILPLTIDPPVAAVAALQLIKLSCAILA